MRLLYDFTKINVSDANSLQIKHVFLCSNTWAMYCTSCSKRDLNSMECLTFSWHQFVYKIEICSLTSQCLLSYFMVLQQIQRMAFVFTNSRHIDVKLN